MPILRMIKRHKLLLDTHVLIWSMLGDSCLSKAFVRALSEASKNNSLLLSPMSIWEIGMLVKKKRISIDMDVMDWVEQVLETPGIALCEITPKIAIQSSRLEGEVHGDPVDRLLITSASENNAVLVTCDKKILEYAKNRILTAYNPCK